MVVLWFSTLVSPTAALLVILLSGSLTRESGGPGGSGVSLVLTEVPVEECLY